MDQSLKDDIIFINKFMYAIQKHRIAMSNWIDSKVRTGVEPTKRAMSLYEKLGEDEKLAKRLAREIVEDHPLWIEFFDKVSGLGESLATSLMAGIGDISKFNTPSALWAYAGLTTEYVKAECENGHKLMMSSGKRETCIVFGNEANEPCGGKIIILETVKGKAPKRMRGYHYCFNNSLKTIFWKVGEQFVKQGHDIYKNVYYVEKERLQNLNDQQKDEKAKLSKLHIHNRAKRKMVKMFAVHLWEAWRTVEGLPLRTPYVIEKLGHKHYVNWKEVLK